MNELHTREQHAQLEAILTELEILSHNTAEHIADMQDEELIAFTDRREALTLSLEPYRASVTDEDKQRIRGILALDGVILARMSELKQEAADWIEKRNVGRHQQKAYQQAYASASMFFDHRSR